MGADPRPLVLVAVADAGDGTRGAPDDPRAIGRALLRRLAAEALGADAETVLLGHDPAGRPIITGPPGASDLRCSLSHAGRVVVAAAALVCRVGVDVEPVDPRRAELATVARFVDAGVAEWLAALPPAAQPRAVALVWTRLEAEAKGRGVALDRLRGRAPVGVAEELAVAPDHVATLWTDRQATVRRIDVARDGLRLGDQALADFGLLLGAPTPTNGKR